MCITRGTPSGAQFEACAEHIENRRRFDSWMERVENHLMDLVGLTSEDLPDADYWDGWDRGDRPRAFAVRILVDEGADWLAS